jgi:hypothetical protein
MLKLFSRKNKAASPADYPGPARDPLLAIPHINQDVEARTDPDDHIHLRRVMPPKNRVDRFFLMITRTDRDYCLEFDDYGSYFWLQIDGRRDLHAIARAVAGHFGMSLDDARAATVRFTRDLMLRHMVHLEIPRPA